ncbi:MAG: hypothetical protein QG668_512 [Patescibacteria group bacterium]|nr:hypothetical protein [Patescibacteria group bacterium]
MVIGGGVAMAVFPGQPFFAFIVGVIVHLLIDMIPHGDADLYEQYVSGERARFAIAYTVLDALAGLLLTIFLLTREVPSSVRESIAWGITGGVLPDILVGLRQILPHSLLERAYTIHTFFHNGVTKRLGDVPLWVGIGVQALGIGALLVVII